MHHGELSYFSFFACNFCSHWIGEPASNSSNGYWYWSSWQLMYDNHCHLKWKDPYPHPGSLCFGTKKSSSSHCLGTNCLSSFPNATILADEMEASKLPNYYLCIMVTWLYLISKLSILCIWPAILPSVAGLVQWWELSHWVTRSRVRSSLSADFTGERLASVFPFPKPHSCGSLQHWVCPFFVMWSAWSIDNALY